MQLQLYQINYRYWLVTAIINTYARDSDDKM